MRILVAITGASGAIYTQRLLDRLNPEAHEIHVITSSYGKVVMQDELPNGLQLPEGVPLHAAKSMNVPFASGSNAFDAMVILPCTMGTLGRIAHGYSEDALLRAADVMLKENKKLILCPRETPLSLVHVKNMELLLQAGAYCFRPTRIFMPVPKPSRNSPTPSSPACSIISEWKTPSPPLARRTGLKSLESGFFRT